MIYLRSRADTSYKMDEHKSFALNRHFDAQVQTNTTDNKTHFQEKLITTGCNLGI